MGAFMCQFAFLLFFVSVCIFAGIMMHDARTLWSGASFLIMVVCLSVFLLMVLYQYSEWLAEHDLVIGCQLYSSICIIVTGSVFTFQTMQSSASNVGKSGLKHKLLSPVVLISLSNPITYPKPFLTNCAAL